MTQQIDFWFSIGSTYTYLTVMRLHDIEQHSGIRFNWRPFSVRALMQEMNNVPFVGKPAKEKYMWRDVARRARKYGIPAKFPVQYPLRHFDLANRVAIVAQQEGWCPDYVRSAYELWFCDGLPAGDDRNLDESVKRAGRAGRRVVEIAESDEIGQAYLAATSKARSLGIFGSPSFVTGDGELFWGDDRLQDAIDHTQATAVT